MNKAFYMIHYQVASGARFNTGYSSDNEISTPEELNSMVSAVARHAVTQGQAQSLEGTTVISCTLMNPSRNNSADIPEDVVVETTMLTHAFVDMYEALEAINDSLEEPKAEINSAYKEMYMNIKGIEDLGNEGES